MRSTEIEIWKSRLQTSGEMKLVGYFFFSFLERREFGDSCSDSSLNDSPESGGKEFKNLNFKEK